MDRPRCPILTPRDMLKPMPTSTTRKRDPYQRDQQAPRKPVAAINQGLEVLHLLDALPYLENDQIERIVYLRTRDGRPRTPAGAAVACNLAVRELFDAGYLDRLPLVFPTLDIPRVNAVNVLTKRGFQAVTASHPEASWNWQPSRTPNWQTVNPHRSWAVSLLAGLLAGVVLRDWGYWSVMDDHHLHRLSGEGVPFGAIPDGFFVIHRPDTGHDYPFFLEVDLGNESQAIWAKKVADYGLFLKNHYAYVFPGLPMPVVLCVADGPKRVANLMQTTGAAGGGGAWWFASLAEATADPFGLIWQTLKAPLTRSIPDRVNRF